LPLDEKRSEKGMCDPRSAQGGKEGSHYVRDFLKKVEKGSTSLRFPWKRGGEEKVAAPPVSSLEDGRLLGKRSGPSCWSGRGKEEGEISLLSLIEGGERTRKKEICSLRLRGEREEETAHRLFCLFSERREGNVGVKGKKDKPSFGVVQQSEKRGGFLLRREKC